MFLKSERTGGGLSMAWMAASSSASVVTSSDFSQGGQTVAHQRETGMVDRIGLSANRTILGLVGSTSASAGVVSHSWGRTQCRVGIIPPVEWQVQLVPKKESGA